MVDLGPFKHGNSSAVKILEADNAHHSRTYDKVKKSNEEMTHYSPTASCI